MVLTRIALMVSLLVLLAGCGTGTMARTLGAGCARVGAEPGPRRRSTLQPIRSSIREGEALRLSTRAQFGSGSAKGVTDGWMGKVVIWLCTLGLVVGFILAALFLVPGPMVKMKGRR
jgi:hypothetical protein